MERAFGEYPEVTVVQGDFFARPADAMVSPANSFGIMDGGLDLAIRGVLGHGVQQTVNAYLAFRATLLAVRAYNREHADSPVRSLVCPGLGTGIGAMDETRCATQMKLAYDHVNAPARIPSAAQIHAIHRALRTS